VCQFCLTHECFSALHCIWSALTSFVQAICKMQPAAVLWCEMHQKAWMMTTTYAWSCISLQFLKMAAHDHAIVIVTLTCSHPTLLHTPTCPPRHYLRNASQCLLQSTIAVHTHNILHPATIQPNLCCSLELHSLLMQQVKCILPTGTQKLGAMCQLVPRCSHGGEWGPEWGPLAVATQDWRDNRGLQRYLSHSSFCCFLFSCLSILVHLTSSWATIRLSSPKSRP